MRAVDRKSIVELFTKKKKRQIFPPQFPSQPVKMLSLGAFFCFLVSQSKCRVLGLFSNKLLFFSADNLREITEDQPTVYTAAVVDAVG